MSTFEYEWQKKTILVVGKTYPQISKKYTETVCTGGITDCGDWIRLYPIPFRYLDRVKQFRKYQWVTVSVKRARSDSRPESYYPNIDTLELGDYFGTDNNWDLRRRYVLPMVSDSLEQLQALNKKNGVSMGLVQVKEFHNLSMIPRPSEVTPRQRQLELFRKVKDLEPPPYDFKFSFSCMGPDCPGHNMMMLDWEIVELCRKGRHRYSDSKDLEYFVRNNYVDKLFDGTRDVYFYLGTHNVHRNSFMVGGAFYFKNADHYPDTIPLF